MCKRNILVTATRLNGKNKDIILSFLFCSKAYEIMKTNNAKKKAIYIQIRCQVKYTFVTKEMFVCSSFCILYICQ